MKFKFTSEPIDKIPVDLLVLMWFQDQIPFHGLMGLIDWRVNGMISHLIEQKKLTGKAREMVLLPSEHRFQADKLIILGLGEREEFHENHVSQVFDFFFETVYRMKATRICVSLSGLLSSPFEWRNAVRLFVSKLKDYPSIQEVIFWEPKEIIQEAKKRQMEFGSQIRVEFE